MVLSNSRNQTLSLDLKKFIISACGKSLFCKTFFSGSAVEGISAHEVKIR